jgi:hypothetical protein
MNDTPRTQELRDDLAGIASEAPIWKLFKKLDCRQLERELTAVTKQRDLLIEVLEVTLNTTVLNHRHDRWHSDAEYALNKIKLNKL